MRTKKELADAVLRRAEELRAEEAKRKRRVYSALAVAAGLLLVVGLSLAVPGLLPSDTATAEEVASTGTATLIAGGVVSSYMVVGVVAFALGVGVALLCLYLRREK